MTTRDPKTREGAERQYRALYRQLRRAWGPDPFGMDWRTMMLNDPVRTTRLRRLHDMIQRLPSGQMNHGEARPGCMKETQ